MRYTFFFHFVSVSDARSALAQFCISGEDENGKPFSDWDQGRVDAGIPIEAVPATFDENGQVVDPAILAPGFHLNLLLDERDEALEQINGWLGTAEERNGQWVLIAGEHPKTPQRVFA